VHVGDTVTDKQDTALGWFQHFERIVTMVTKRPIGKDCGSRAKQGRKEWRKSFFHVLF
jgi:hypothetical protein